MTLTHAVNPYLVQSSERQEPEYFTTENHSLLRWMPWYQVKVQTDEFLDIQQRFQGFPQKKQLQEYRKVNKHIFAWKYLAPYAVLESLKDKEDAWYEEGLKIKSSDFRQERHAGRSSDKIEEHEEHGHPLLAMVSPRDTSNKSFTPSFWDLEFPKLLHQEIFMTAQFCWWYKEIEKKYPQVWRKMKERFCKDDNWNMLDDKWNCLVDNGKLPEYIPQRFLADGVGGVNGVFPWTKLRVEYCCEFRCLQFPKWYTLWDCNLQIFQKNKIVTIPAEISWSDSNPTYHKTYWIWDDIRHQIKIYVKKMAAEFHEAERHAQHEAAAPVMKTVEQALGLTDPWNYYQVLKVDSAVDESDEDITRAYDEDILRAYERLAREWRPDNYKESAEIDEKVYKECGELIHEAYETIKNASGRRRYNAGGWHRRYPRRAV